MCHVAHQPEGATTTGAADPRPGGAEGRPAYGVQLNRSSRPTRHAGFELCHSERCPLGSAFAGIDRAPDDHSVTIVVPAGRAMVQFTVDRTAAGLRHPLLAAAKPPSGLGGDRSA